MFARIGDRLVNLVSGLGTAKDKQVGARYHFAELTPDQIIMAYRSDWIARKVVDIPAFDMVREGRHWQAEDGMIEKLEAEEARLQVWPKLAKALRLARLYGGSAIILGVGDLDTSQPLLPDRIVEGGLGFIHVANRWEITAGEIDRDPASPGWGEPRQYTMSSPTRGQVRLHPSRVIPFLGAEVPEISMATSWGDSILQAVDEAVKNAGLASNGIAQLLQEAKVDVFKIPNFMASVGDEAYRQKVIDRISLANQAKSITNGLLMDKEEDYQQKQVSFSQLPEVLSLYLQIAAGAADIPATRLLGQSPAGMNATGESDLRNYYDRLAAEQEVHLRPRLEKLDAVLIRSALGSRPPEVHFTFAPLWQVSDKERADIFKTKADAARALIGTGGASPPIVPIEALSDALCNSFVEDGSLPGLEAALEEYGNFASQEVDGDDDLAALGQRGAPEGEATFRRREEETGQG
jgi:phage-related protein (TIGR01555 family)